MELEGTPAVGTDGDWGWFGERKKPYNGFAEMRGMVVMEGFKKG